jgi:hypothetical protein
VASVGSKKLDRNPANNIGINSNRVRTRDLNSPILAHF